MKILVLGGTTGTGRETVANALERGHQVTAAARNPDKLDLKHPALRVVKGDVSDAASLQGAVAGSDAVIFAVGATFDGLKKNPLLFSTGTRNTISVMKSSGVKRLVVLSSFGSGESRRWSGFVLNRILRPLLLHPYYDDHDRQEAVVRSEAQGLDWVIVEPSMLRNGPARKKYRIADSGGTVPVSIRRADVADFLVTAAESDHYFGKAVAIGG
jgi:putative NADH-flavin reductase